jgi:hypothetical protein
MQFQPAFCMLPAARIEAPVELLDACGNGDLPILSTRDAAALRSSTGTV